MPLLQAIIHKLYVNIWSTMIRLISVNVEISFRVLNDTRASVNQRKVSHIKQGLLTTINRRVLWWWLCGGTGMGG